jgi:hypothetical protein
VIFWIAFFIQTWISIWLRGRGYFLFLVACLTIAMGLMTLDFFMEDITVDDVGKITKDAVSFIWFYLCFLYGVSTNYITKTPFLDLKYSSYKKLREFLANKNEISKFERFILVLGPALFISMLVLVVYLIFMKLLG